MDTPTQVDLSLKVDYSQYHDKMSHLIVVRILRSQTLRLRLIEWVASQPVRSHYPLRRPHLRNWHYLRGTHNRHLSSFCFVLIYFKLVISI